MLVQQQYQQGWVGVEKNAWLPGQSHWLAKTTLMETPRELRSPHDEKVLRVLLPLHVQGSLLTLSE